MVHFTATDLVDMYYDAKMNRLNVGLKGHVTIAESDNIEYNSR